MQVPVCVLRLSVCLSVCHKSEYDLQVPVCVLRLSVCLSVCLSVTSLSMRCKFRSVCYGSLSVCLSVCHKCLTYKQWCIAKNGGGYTQTGVAKGLKVPCLFMITEVSIHCQKTRRLVYSVYPPIHHCLQVLVCELWLSVCLSVCHKSEYEIQVPVCVLRLSVCLSVCHKSEYEIQVPVCVLWVCLSVCLSQL